MGIITSCQMIDAQMIAQSKVPVIVCRPCAAATEAGKEYTRLSLNVALARGLAGVPVEERNDRVMREIKSIIAGEGSLWLTDYEMLFDPRYNIDAIKVFCEIAKSHKIIIPWTGKRVEHNLIYAELGLADYHTYDINKYEIFVIG